MQFTFLSKAVRATLSEKICANSLMAMLSIVVATTLQQPVQAQSLIAKDKNGVCAPLPAGVFYQEFGGITFSPTQKAAYRKIEAKINKRYKVISDNAKSVDIPDGVLGVQLRPGVPNEKADEINVAVVKMSNDGLSTSQQAKLLTQKYGKYAIFSLGKTTVYTPEQIAKGRRIGRDFEAQTMAILTPEQQKIYKLNLALQQRVQACGTSDTPFDRIISPLPY
jgi:hypothetical protein